MEKMEVRNRNRYPKCIDGEGETDADRLEELEYFLILTHKLRTAQKNYNFKPSGKGIEIVHALEKELDDKMWELLYPQGKLI